MTYLYIVFYILIDAILLQPIKLFLTLGTKILWFPNVSDELYRNRGVKNYAIDKNSEVLNFDPIFAVNDADGFKFLAILTANLCKVKWAEPKYTQLKTILLSYIDDNGDIGRHPIGHTERHTAPNFSGDMASGLLYWLATEYTKLHGFDCKDLTKIQTLFTKTTLPGTDSYGGRKGILTFMNVANTGYGRGSIYTLLGLSQEPLRLLLWLKLAHLYTGQTIFSILHAVASILYKPLLWVNPGDYCVFVGNVKAISWFPQHSSAYVCAAYYLLTKSSSAKNALRGILRRHVWSPTLYALWASMFPNGDLPRSDIYKDISTVRDYVDGILFKGTIPYPGKYTKFYDVKGFEVDREAISFCTPEMLGHKFSCENNPIKPQLCSDERRQSTKVDWLCAASHLL